MKYFARDWEELPGGLRLLVGYWKLAAFIQMKKFAHLQKGFKF